MVSPIQAQKFLKGVSHAVDKSAPIRCARKLGADEDVCNELGQLPDKQLQTPADVSQARGKLHRPSFIGHGGQL